MTAGTNRVLWALAAGFALIAVAKLITHDKIPAVVPLATAAAFGIAATMGNLTRPKTPR